MKATRMRVRKAVEYFCPRCSYVTREAPINDVCPACGGGENQVYKWEGGDPDVTVRFNDLHQGI